METTMINYLGIKSSTQVSLSDLVERLSALQGNSLGKKTVYVTKIKQNLKVK